MRPGRGGECKERHLVEGAVIGVMTLQWVHTADTPGLSRGIPIGDCRGRGRREVQVESRGFWVGKGVVDREEAGLRKRS